MLYILHQSCYVNQVTTVVFCFQGGIIQHHCSDSVENLDHAVQIVGYDLTGGRPKCYVAVATRVGYTCLFLVVFLELTIG